MAKGKKKNRPAASEVTVIPAFYDKDKQLKTLKQGNFPHSRAGKMAYCDYQIEKWKVKRVIIETRTDPLSKKRKKREKLVEQLKKLEEELRNAEAEEKKIA